MSIELVLLIAAFLVLPFLQQLARQRQQPQQQPAPTRKQPPAPEHRLPGGAMIGPKRKPERRKEAPVALAIGRSVRRSMTAAGLGDPLALRRAIVLTTVLRPCRAASPHGSPGPGGHQ